MRGWRAERLTVLPKVQGIQHSRLPLLAISTIFPPSVLPSLPIITKANMYAWLRRSAGKRLRAWTLSSGARIWAQMVDLPGHFLSLSALWLPRSGHRDTKVMLRDYSILQGWGAFPSLPHNRICSFTVPIPNTHTGTDFIKPDIKGMTPWKQHTKP